MKKRFQTNIAMNDPLTLDCVGPTQFSVIQTIHCNFGMKCFFFQSYQNVCLLLSLCMHISFIYHKVV